MNEEISIMPIVVGALARALLRLRGQAPPEQLRETFNVFDKQESTDRPGARALGRERPAPALCLETWRLNGDERRSPSRAARLENIRFEFRHVPEFQMDIKPIKPV